MLPSNYWPTYWPTYYWPIGATAVPIPPVTPVAGVESRYGPWVPGREPDVTGNNYIVPAVTGGPVGNDDDGPFGPFRPGGRP